MLDADTQMVSGLTRYSTLAVVWGGTKRFTLPTAMLVPLPLLRMSPMGTCLFHQLHECSAARTQTAAA